MNNYATTESAVEVHVINSSFLTVIGNPDAHKHWKDKLVTFLVMLVME
jgi:hypothetical protein